MVTDDKDYKQPLIYAIGLHIILFAFLIVRFHWVPEKPVTLSTVNIINAVAVSQSQLNQPVTKAVEKLPQTKQEPVKPTTQQSPSKPSLQQKKAPVQKPLVQTIKQVEQPSVVKEIPAKKLAESKNQQLEHKKIIAEQIQQELAAQEKQTKATQAAAAKKLVEQTAQQLLQQELAATNAQASVKNELTAAQQGEIDKYKTMILQAISQQWILPPDLKKDLVAKLAVKVAPGGMVVDVKIVQSSGNAALDRSAQTAVYKASPLPVPKESLLFDDFRTINLTVRPEGILAGDN